VTCEEALGNILKNHFFTVAWELIDAGHLRELSGSAVKLYLVLMRLAQKHSAVRIELPAYRARELAGLTAETVAEARRELEAAGLVTCGRGEHGVTTYELLDPETRVPLPAPKGFSGLLRHHPTPGSRARTARKQVVPVDSTATLAPSWDDIGKTESTTRKQSTANPLPHTESGDGESVSTMRKFRECDTENPLPAPIEAPEDACLNKESRSLKPSLKKKLSEQREVSTERTCPENGNLMPCYVHRTRTPHWKRGADWLCALCTPDPAEVRVQ
jgi:hypothetical protein